jgi:glutamyl-tRNA synthetase
MELKELILKHALINAFLYQGKTKEDIVIKKVLAEKPELKEEIKKVVEIVKEVVKEVNSLSLEEQKKLMEKKGIKIELNEKKEELPELPKAEKGKVITAFPPEPSKYPHLGHAKAAFLNFIYAKKYQGKFILRFEDNNPKKVEKVYYKEFIKGLRWLGIRWDKIDYVSDFIPKFYEAVETLIKKNLAYVCLCKQKRIKKLRWERKECEHRNFSVQENLDLWEKMLKEFKEGEANLRLKGDMQSENATLRDPVLMRVIDHKHPRKNYRVWPTYDFATSLMDVWERVTHRFRSKEFEIRKELQDYLRSLFEWKTLTFEFGRLNIKGALTSGRKIRELMKKKELRGWDDPRLVTLAALKRRGFVPEAIKDFILKTGISKADAEIEFETLESINRQHIDKIANRYFAIFQPKIIKIVNPPNFTKIKLKVHPEKKRYKELSIDWNEILIEKEDFEIFKNREVGLIGLGKVILKEESEFLSTKVEKSLQKIHWLCKPYLKAKIVLPDAKEIEVLIEKNLRNEKEGKLVQLVRKGFCKIDKMGKEIILYFSHK